jgi:NADH-quinone oxidoreductase subunit C
VAPVTTEQGPAIAALRAKFGESVRRASVSCGDTSVVVAREAAHTILAWLKSDQSFNYLIDVTAVEFRDRELPIEVVYHLWSMDTKTFLRVKIELDRLGPLVVDSIVDLWKGADWMEREVWDMFGIRFTGHPDLRRILMWENYSEGHPLRKDFPLRGRFSRAEQVRQALSNELEKHYSMEELSMNDAQPYLPMDMREKGAGRGDGA